VRQVAEGVKSAQDIVRILERGQGEQPGVWRHVAAMLEHPVLDEFVPVLEEARTGGDGVAQVLDAVTGVFACPVKLPELQAEVVQADNGGAVFLAKPQGQRADGGKGRFHGTLPGRETNKMELL
jgi:hypothetical protein